MKFKFSQTRPLVFLILLLFLFTRLYKILDIPASLYWDEASIGYNAYSILKTGKDEWGKTFPLHFKAFGEYKLPVYIYTVSLFQVFLGPTELSVRLPSVLFSLGAIYLVYLLTNQFFKEKRAALLAAFFCSISPWFFIFSRTGYEATAGLFFFLLGIFYWLLFKKSPFFLLLSSLAFVLSIYSYNSFRIITPLSLSVLVMYLFSDRGRNFKLTFNLLIALSILILAAAPIFSFFSKGEEKRFETVGILDSQKTDIEIMKIFTKNYLSHFNPQFLFLTGDKNIRSQQEKFGQLYPVEAPLLLLGIFTLLKIKRLSLLYFLLISFIPSALTKESPHALRALAAVPFIGIISAAALSRYRLKKIYSVAIAIFMILFLLYFFSFIKNYNLQSSEAWQYGYKKIFVSFANQFDKFDHVVVSDRLNQPYIFALFYLKYDPGKFRREVLYNTSIRKATSSVKSFNKFIFTNIDYYNLPKGRILIFSTPTDKMDELKAKEVILNHDNSPGIYVYEYKN